MKTYYKVVKDDLTSADVLDSESYRTLVQYKVNEWVEAPEGTRLFVFDNLCDAKGFVGSIANKKIFECKVMGVCKGTYTGVEYCQAKEFWRRFNTLFSKKKKVDISIYDNLISFTLPSIFVKKVKLIKEIR